MFRTIELLSVIAAFLACSGCVTSPVAVVAPTGEVLKGSATGYLTGGTFEVTDGTLTCSGNYNPATGRPTVEVAVVCSDGRKGIGVADRGPDGLSGSGVINLNDGSVVRFIYGSAAHTL